MFFFSLVIISASLHTSQGSISAGTEPSGPVELKVGDTLTLRCFVKEEKYSSENLNFFMNGNPVDESFVRIKSRTVIELNMPNMQMQSYSFVCKHHGSAVGYNDVRVGYPPQPVEDFKCFSSDWDNLTCSWHRPYNPVAVQYNLSYSTDISPSTSYQCNEMTKDSHTATCFFLHQSYRRASENFTFTLTSYNSLDSIQETISINNYAIVVPSPVINVTCSEITSNSVKVSWQNRLGSTIGAFVRNLDFEFLIENKYSENILMRFKNEAPHLSQMTLELPYAHTWFSIKMRRKCNISEEKEELWSGWSNTSVKTEARSPDNSPAMEVGGFNVANGGDVYIYWKHLPEQYHNGENFSYIVHSDDSKTLQPRVTYLFASYSKERFDNTKNNTITVLSSNEKGRSGNASKLRIPSAETRLSPPRNLVKTLTNEVYNLTWLPPSDSANEISSYTVFWCPVKSELPNNCETSINFVKREPWETFFHLSSNQTVNFAVSANSLTSTSGMKWSDCTAVNSYDIGKIKTIWIPKVTSTTIEVEWKLECTDKGVVEGYQIEYCPIEEPKTLKCVETAVKVNVTTQKHTLENLKPYKTYKIDLRMYSLTTIGPLSDPLVNTTSESGNDIE